MNDNNADLKEIKLESDLLTKSLTDLNIALDELTEGQTELTSQLEEVTKALKEGAKSFKDIEESVKRANLQFDKNAAVLNNSDGSLRQNKAVLNSLLERYELLAEQLGDNSKEVKTINAEIGGLSNTIEKQEKKLAKSREVFDLHAKSIKAFSSSFDSIKDFGSGFSDALESASKGFNAMKDGLSDVKTGLQGVGGAIKATGFGLLILVLQSVTEYLTKTPRGAEKMRVFLAGLGVIVDKVSKGFQALGGIIVNAILSPIDSINKLSLLIKENILNRFSALSVILDGIVHLDFKKASNGVIQAFTGVTNASDKVVKAYQNIKQGIKETAEAVQKAAQEQTDKSLVDKANKVKEAAKQKKKQEEDAKRRKAAADKAKEEQQTANQAKLNATRQLEEKAKQLNKDAEEERLASIVRIGQTVLEGYAKEIKDTEEHFKQLKDKYKGNKETLEQLKKEETKSIAAINKKFRDEDAAKLDEHHKQLAQLALDYTTNTQQKELAALEQETKEKLSQLDKGAFALLNNIKNQQALVAKLKAEGKTEEAAISQKSVDDEMKVLETSGKTRLAILNDQKKKENVIKKEAPLQSEIDKARNSGHETNALQKELELLKIRQQFEINAAEDKEGAIKNINEKYAKQKAEIEEKLTTSRIHAGDKYIDAVLKNTKKDSAIYKAAFMAKKATSIADVVMSTKKSIIASFEGYANLPFIGQAMAIAQGAFIATQGAMSIAEIVKQKPGFAQGGQYVSDGRGTLLPGYSRTDNTNAYLRSGEAVVVSEAMRNPWARNLVSAINVAHGGRDFSIPNPARGYAIGGIFTDGGNANRYYSQPVNDQKDLANTLAYQMINNFPPIYVDVKDVNNQQNILAQTVNRVNL